MTAGEGLAAVAAIAREYGVGLRRADRLPIENRAPFDVRGCEYAIDASTVYFRVPGRVGLQQIAGCIHELGHIVFDWRRAGPEGDWLPEPTWLAWEDRVARRAGLWRAWSIQMADYQTSEGLWGRLSAAKRAAALEESTWAFVAHPWLRSAGGREFL